MLEVQLKVQRGRVGGILGWSR